MQHACMQASVNGCVTGPVLLLSFRVSLQQSYWVSIASKGEKGNESAFIGSKWLILAR